MARFSLEGVDSHYVLALLGLESFQRNKFFNPMTTTQELFCYKYFTEISEIQFNPDNF